MKKSKLRYIELSIPAFFDVYPEVAASMNPFLVLDLLSEPGYVVRFAPNSARFEFGFPDDDWEVFK